MTTDATRAIAKDGYIYGFPMVDSYRVMHSYFVDTADPEYKGPWNQVHSTARVYTPDDTAIQTPNSDTPYSAVGADLRAEPLVLTVPPIEQNRYYSLQFVDGYTYNFGYVGSRTTGNGGGTYLLAGPGWTGEKPAGIDAVIQADTELVLVLYRTQLFGPDDIDNVRAIQAGYLAEPLSAFLKQPAPPQAPAIEFAEPLSREQQRTSPQFFDLLRFVLGFAPVLPEEKQLRAQIATLNDASQDAVEAGIADAWAELEMLKRDKIDTGQVGSAQLFGTREALAGNYLYRMAGAALGIYGNTAAEAIYPHAAVDTTGESLTGIHRYMYTFAPGQLPPVNAFWSLTLYGMPQSQLVANPINRYLVNSPMLDHLVADADGGYTLHVQHATPGPDVEANWLPAPDGPFMLILRLYRPKTEALDGSWRAPRPVKVT